MSDIESIINKNQGIRSQLINAMIEGGIPKDPDSIKLLLQVLKDSDSTELGKKKNAIEDKNATSSEAIAAGIAEFVRAQKNTNPFSRSADGAPVNNGHIPEAIIPEVDPEKLGQHDLVDGEGEIGIVQEDSASFFNRMGVELKKKAD